MPSATVFTVEALERERQARLKEAVAGEPTDDAKEARRERLQDQIKSFQAPPTGESLPTCKSYATAEAVIIKAMKSGKKNCDLRLDLTHQKLTVVPADVLRLGDSLCQLSVVGNFICELPADLDLCRRLRVLNLAANELAGLPNLSGLKELMHVGLAYNKVDDMSVGTLCRCLPRCLDSLDLAGNELCDLETFLDLFNEKFERLQHLSLKANPLAIRAGYKSIVGKSSFGAHLTQLDGVEMTAEIREAPLPGAGGGAAGAGAPAAAEAEGDEEGADGEEGAAEEGEEEEGANMITLRVKVMQLAGVPMPAAKATDADAAEPAADEDGGGSSEQIVVSFTVSGKTSTTRPMARAETIDFEDTVVDLRVPRSVDLRDEIIVHGVPFEVFVVKPSDAEGEGDAEGGGAGADGAEGEGAGEGEGEGSERTLLGQVRTRWDAWASGEAELTQVCRELVHPPAPKPRKGKKRAAKVPPPYTLSVTASVSIVS
jgi:hypothetical protein